MESKSLLQTHFLAYTHEVNSDLSGEDILYSFIFELVSEEKIRAAFNYIFSEKNNKPFSLTIKVNKDTAGSGGHSYLDKIFLILSHPLYYKHKGKTVVGIYAEGGSQYYHHTFFQQLGFELRRQDFQTLFIDFHNHLTDKVSPSEFYFEDKLIPDNDFYNWCLSRLETHATRLQLFHLYNTRESARKIAVRDAEMEKRLQDENPVLYKLIQKEILFAEKEYKSAITIERLKADITSKKEYLDFLLGKNMNGKFNDADLLPSMRIQKFYHQEYEILPLWYKRLGHIIKVFTGKRSFRSLFSDKGSNYKK